MQALRDIISHNIDRHSQFEYYELIISEIEDNLLNNNSDITIESCKSLIEGIAKTILKELDDPISEKDLRNINIGRLFNVLSKKLEEYCVDYEAEFIYKIAGFIAYIGEIRNNRGDISHGKRAPKESSSDKHFATLISKITEAISLYILQQFYSIDFSSKLHINYEDNPNFNEYLNNSYPLPGLTEYSLALYHQDYNTYEEEFRIYINNEADV